MKLVVAVVAAAALLWALYSFLQPSEILSPTVHIDSNCLALAGPLPSPLLKYSPTSLEYSIALVSDMDTDSKREGKWISILKKGVLHRNPKTGNYTVTWTSETELSSKFSESGRAMELSALVYFNGRLLAFDDRTGLVLDVQNDEAVPVTVLMNGDGTKSKGFKTEWATVKDNVLYVGSMGKEWTNNDGEILNEDPEWIKMIDTHWGVQHQSWVPVYNALRVFTRTTHPGYLLHEAVTWNEHYRRWFFLPRRFSREPYNEVHDELRGSNIVISCDEKFEDIQSFRVGDLIPTHGFSAFKFMPHRPDEIVALKTKEFQGSIDTYIMVFNLEGKILMEETKLPSLGIKFEGLEIV